jgi:uncharacterized protein (TIGR00661 family)
MRIFYGVNGEGLGHTSRTLAVVDQLPDCEVHIFTYGAAYRFLQAAGYPHLHPISGLTFSYRRQRVNYLRSLSRAGAFCLGGLRENIERIQNAAVRLRPDVFVSDFEPSVARAARACRSRLVSVDNQHRFVHCRLSELPRSLQVYARGAAFATRLMVPFPDHVVISSFHTDAHAPTSHRITLTGGMLRKTVESTPVTNEGFLLAYVRPSISDIVLRALADVDCQVRVYGAPHSEVRRGLERDERFHFRQLSPDFVHDLANCDRVIGSAGHQLICEARFFQKPLLTIPEPGQYEQYINAWYVQQNGLGMQCGATRLTGDVVRDFIRRGRMTCPRMENGVQRVVQVIRNEHEVHHAAPQPLHF